MQTTICVIFWEMEVIILNLLMEIDNYVGVSEQ